MKLRQSSFLVLCLTAIIAFLLVRPASATDLIDAVRAGNVGRVCSCWILVQIRTNGHLILVLCTLQPEQVQLKL